MHVRFRAWVLCGAVAVCTWELGRWCRCCALLLCSCGSLGAGAAAVRCCCCVHVGAWALVPLQCATVVCVWELGAGAAAGAGCWCCELVAHGGNRLLVLVVPGAGADIELAGHVVPVLVL